jgi:hypothetical protein
MNMPVSRGIGFNRCAILMVLFLFVAVDVQAAPTAMDPRERAVLMQLFVGTDGPNWVRNTGWSEGDPCTPPGWVNVVCTIDDAFVLFLNLAANGLNGPLPPELGTLRAIEEISVELNQISGEFPPDLSNLIDLKILNLSSNQIVGEIPENILHLQGLAPGALRLNYNALFTNNPEVDSFLDNKSNFDWSSTQTIAPSGIQVHTLSGSSVELSWEAIEFTDFSGRYTIALSTNPGGPYDFVGATADKLTTTFQLQELSQDTTYYALIYSETDPHPVNFNKVISAPSEELEFQSAAISLFSINPGLNGSWFNAETSGQGFFIDVFPEAGELFVGWFTYGQESPPAGSEAVVGDPGHRWLTAQGPFQL